MSELFGSYLRKLRLKSGLGLRSFAKVIGWLPSNLSNLENNKINPPRDQKTLFKIAQALKLTKNTENWDKFFDLAANTPERMPVKRVSPISIRMRFAE